jgi:hypothetical protein
MSGVHIRDECLFFATLGSGTEHNGGAVGIVGTDVNAVIASQFLEAHPNVGLNVLDEMTDMDVSIGIRERSGNENFTCQNWNVPAMSG